MSKQKSKTKTIILKSFCGIRMFLSIFFLGSSVFASGFSFPVEQTEEVEKKDLSVFVSKLSERLQGVFGELLDLGGSVASNTGTGSSLLNSLTTTSSQQTQLGLEDISSSSYQSDIELLARRGIIDGQRSRFYPQNYLRRYEMVMMLVKYYLYAQKQQFPQIVFSTRGWFADVAQNMSYAPYVAYADQQGWLTDFVITKDTKKYFYPNKFLPKNDICTFLSVDCSDIPGTGNITREEFVHLLVQQEPVEQLPSTKTSNTNSIFSTLKTVFAFRQ